MHLVLCGLRQRFRLPAGRPLAWAAALLAAVVLGAFGAAAGTWLGWQTAASVPSDRELRALNAATTGMPAPAAVYAELSAMTGPGAAVRADGTSDYSAERIRAGLISAGWQITSFHERDGAVLADLEKGGVDAYVAEAGPLQRPDLRDRGLIGSIEHGGRLPAQLVTGDRRTVAQPARPRIRASSTVRPGSAGICG